MHRNYKGNIERTVGKRFSLGETFDIGSDTGTPVIEDYAENVFKFTGKLERVDIKLP